MGPRLWLALGPRPGPRRPWRRSRRRWPARSVSRAEPGDGGRRRCHLRRRPASAGHAGGARGARPPRRRATFFCVGEQAERYPSLCGEIAAAGHAVGVHGQRHRYQLRLDAGPGRATTSTAAPRRSPPLPAPRPRPTARRTGSSARPGCATVRRRGLRSASVVAVGARLAGLDHAAKRSPRRQRRTSEGDVILLHDADHYSAPGSWRRTLAALPRILERIHARGLRASVP